jgi:HEAT repeat protein
MARAAAFLACLLMTIRPSDADAYITAPVQSLGQLCESTYITLVSVEKFSKEKGVIIYRKVRDLKGTYPCERIRHAFDLKNTPQHKGPGDVPVRPDEVDWRYALDWAEAGKTAVVFSLKYDPYGDFGHTYIDRCWYATMCPARDWDFWWSIYSDPALLKRWHCGTTAQLAAAVELILAGKTAVVPTLVEGSRDELRQGRGKIQGLRVGAQLRDYNPDRDRVADFLVKDLAAILKDLESPERRLRLEGLHAAASAGSEARAALSKVLPLIDDSDEELRLAALGALLRIEPANARIASGARPFLKHADPQRRIQALEILSAIPAEADPSGLLNCAAALLEEADPQLRRRSSLALARIGKAATPVVGALAKLLKETDRELRILGAETLGRIGGEAAVAALAETVRSDASGTVRMRAADSLARLGPAAKPARPALEAALNDPAMAQRPEVLEKIRETLKLLK